MTSDDDIEDDVCDGYPEHRGVRETYRGDDGIQWECTRCGAEGWEDAVTSDDGTDVEDIRIAEEMLPAGREVLPPWDSDGTVDRRVAFIGQPGSGKTVTASCCGERDDIPLQEEILELPGFVGMIHSGKADLSQRAKDIARGRPVEDTP